MDQTTRNNKEKVGSFLSALQLCIKGVVVASWDDNLANLTLRFDEQKTEPSLQTFSGIVSGQWMTEHEFFVSQVKEILSHEFISFLLVTRLVKENMIKAAEIEPSYKKYVQKLGLTSARDDCILKNLEQARRLIFDQMAEKKMTWKELSQKSGLTSMALNNFKTGSDMRLSSFLKITQALGLKLILQK